VYRGPVQFRVFIALCIAASGGLANWYGIHAGAGSYNSVNSLTRYDESLQVQQEWGEGAGLNGLWKPARH
jgi:hypothetical protein